MSSFIAILKATGKSLDDMDELLMHELKDLYDAEQRLIEALPKMEAAASSPQLKQAFHHHLEQTKRQKMRLEQVFDALGKKAERQTCDGMKGILEEGTVIINAKGKPAVKDAALIAAAQRVEHYEMASYGAARTFANQLGRSDVADILQRTLDEEGNADHELTRVAMSGLNRQASQGSPPPIA